MGKVKEAYIDLMNQAQSGSISYCPYCGSKEIVLEETDLHLNQERYECKKCEAMFYWDG